jgi:hypothetical protein
MGILLTCVCQRGYHSQQRLDARYREPTAWRSNRCARQAGRNNGDDALNPRSEPDDADPPEPLLDGDRDQREGEAVERMRRIRDGDGVSRGECSQPHRGSL